MLSDKLAFTELTHKLLMIFKGPNRELIVELNTYASISNFDKSNRSFLKTYEAQEK